VKSTGPYCGNRQQFGRHGGKSGEHPDATGNELTGAAGALKSFSTFVEWHPGQTT